MFTFNILLYKSINLSHITFFKDINVSNITMEKEKSEIID